MIVVLATSTSTLLAQSSIEQSLRATTKKTYDTNCSTLVETIREDTRKRIAILEQSIEQIYTRHEISIGPKKVECEGEALLSNSKRYSIKYGAEIDANGEWIISYSLSE